VGAFEAPFPFTGVLHTVVFELDDDPVIDGAGELRAALRQQ